MAPQLDEIFKQKVNDCVQHNIAEVHQFPRNSVMEFSEYLQWDGGPVFLRHPVGAERDIKLYSISNSVHTTLHIELITRWKLLWYV